MTVYCDSSSLLKLYIEEPHSDDIEALARSATAVVTSSLAYVEVRAAFGRAHREHRVTRASLAAATGRFQEDWGGFLLVVPDSALLRSAAELAERHALRALDAIHLASFQQVLERTDDDVEFSSFDERLNKAARRLR